MTKTNVHRIHKTNKSSKSSKSNKRTRKTNKNKKNNSRSKVMRGGDDGRFVLPPSYFGGKQNGYVADATSLSGAVSQGMISANGQFAGPNLFPSSPTMIGGGCGCSGKRVGKTKSRLLKSKKSKSRQTKSKINKRR